MLFKQIIDYNLIISILNVWGKQMFAAQQAGRGQLSRALGKEINVALDSINDLTKAWYRSAIKLD